MNGEKFLGDFNATARLWLQSQEKKARKSDGRQPVKIEIYTNEQFPRKRVNTGFYYTKDEWDRLNAVKLKDEKLKEDKKTLGKLLDKANDVIKQLGRDYTPHAFDQMFSSSVQSDDQIKEKVVVKPPKPMPVTKNTLTNSKGFTDMYEGFQLKINELLENDQKGTADTYAGTRDAFKKYKSTLEVKDITAKFLKSFELWAMSEKDEKTGKPCLAYSSIGIYMRNLKHIYKNSKNGLSKDDLHGISGCGLWHIIIIYDEQTDAYSYDYRLIGIMTEYRKGKYFCLIGNKIYDVLRAIIKYEGIEIDHKVLFE